MRQSKTLMLSMNVGKQSLETEFLIAICRLNGDKWQSKTLFLAIFDRHLSIVKIVFDCRLSGVIGVIDIFLYHLQELQREIFFKLPLLVNQKP